MRVRRPDERGSPNWLERFGRLGARSGGSPGPVSSHRPQSGVSRGRRPRQADRRAAAKRRPACTPKSGARSFSRRFARAAGEEKTLAAIGRPRHQGCSLGSPFRCFRSFCGARSGPSYRSDPSEFPRARRFSGQQIGPIGLMGSVGRGARRATPIALDIATRWTAGVENRMESPIPWRGGTHGEEDGDQSRQGQGSSSAESEHGQSVAHVQDIAQFPGFVHLP